MGEKIAEYYSTSARRWARLNRVAVVFEFEVDAQGNSKAGLRRVHARRTGRVKRRTGDGVTFPSISLQ